MPFIFLLSGALHVADMQYGTKLSRRKLCYILVGEFYFSSTLPSGSPGVLGMHARKVKESVSRPWDQGNHRAGWLLGDKNALCMLTHFPLPCQRQTFIHQVLSFPHHSEVQIKMGATGGWSDITADRVFAWHIANLILIPDIPYGPGACQD